MKSKEVNNIIVKRSRLQSTPLGTPLMCLNLLWCTPDGFPGLRAYIRLACKWDGAAAIPYAKKSFKALLDQARNLADITINVGDKRICRRQEDMLKCLLANMQNAKRTYPAVCCCSPSVTLDATVSCCDCTLGVHNR